MLATKSLMSLADRYQNITNPEVLYILIASVYGATVERNFQPEPAILDIVNVIEKYPNMAYTPICIHSQRIDLYWKLAKYGYIDAISDGVFKYERVYFSQYLGKNWYKDDDYWISDGVYYLCVAADPLYSTFSWSLIDVPYEKLYRNGLNIKYILGYILRGHKIRLIEDKNLMHDLFAYHMVISTGAITNDVVGYLLDLLPKDYDITKNALIPEHNTRYWVIHDILTKGFYYGPEYTPCKYIVKSVAVGDGDDMFIVNDTYAFPSAGKIVDTMQFGWVYLSSDESYNRRKKMERVLALYGYTFDAVFKIREILGTVKFTSNAHRFFQWLINDEDITMDLLSSIHISEYEKKTFGSYFTIRIEATITSASKEEAIKMQNYLNNMNASP
jgi:hypothetical protein